MNDNEILEAVKEELNNSIGNDLTKGVNEIGQDESLFNLGLDSLNLVKFIVAVEDRFEIEFEDDDIMGKNWKNYNTIIELIKKRCN